MSQAAIKLDQPELVSPEIDMALKLVFAANLRRLLRERDVLSKDLAEKLGVSTTIVTQWKNADRFPGAENIEKIAHFFKVSYAELFREDAVQTPHGTPTLDEALQILAKARNFRLVRIAEAPEPDAPAGGKKTKPKG